MAVYVDGERNGYGRMIMCHMIADTPEELHTMAQAIGLRREWYQSPAKASFPHYDLSLSRRKLAIQHGALEIGRQELATHMRVRKSRMINRGQTWKSTGWL